MVVRSYIGFLCALVLLIAAGAPAAPDEGTTETLRAPRTTVRPPLSLEEALSQLRQAQLRLAAADGAVPEDIPQTIGSVINYLSFRDDLHTSLANYTWTALGNAKVENSTRDRDELSFDPPVKRVSALTFEAVGGDLRVQKLWVYDEFDRLRDEFDYEAEPRVVRSDLPRRQVFHLWRRTTIKRVEWEASRLAVNERSPVSPRLILLGGITDRPEHVKTALYQLMLAQTALQEANRKQATETLARAAQALADQLKR